MTREQLSQRRRKITILAIGAGCYALAFAWGSQIDAVGRTALGETLLRFAFALPIALLVLLALLEGVPRFIHPKETPPATKPFHTFAAFALMLCCYAPMLLIEFPGSFTYDTLAQGAQISSQAYSTFFPLLHTLLLRFCLSFASRFESFERCALLYSLIQMTLLSACFAEICASVSRFCSRRASRIVLACFCLWPYHWIFACNCTKDVLFSATFALFVTLSLEWVCAGTLSKAHGALLVAAGAAACLLRNNMIYAVLVWLVVLPLVGGRRCRRVWAFTLLAVGIAWVGNRAMIAYTDASGGDVKEMLCVPMQQLGRAYQERRQAFSEEEQALFAALFRYNAHTRYDPTLADGLKSGFITEAFTSDPKPVIEMWLSVGKQCPDVYLDAFLHTAYPFFYPYASYQGTALYIETGMKGGELTKHFGQPDMVQPRRFAALRAFLDANIWHTGARDIPVLRWVFNAGLLMWAMLFCELRQAYAGNWSRFAVLMLPVLLWGTYLLGPVMQGRYAYPFVCLLPVLCVCGAKARGETAAAQKNFTKST